MNRHPIVVGIDDSPETQSALSWAAEEAGSRRVPVRLVCAVRPELDGRLPAFVSVSSVDVADARQLAEQLLADATKTVTRALPQVEVLAETVDGDPVRVLVDESARASLVVLGSRQLRAVASAVLGSVSAAVAAHSVAPTVVVRGWAGRPEEGASVVVGVDGTEASQPTLAYAFEHANRHHVPLRAVLCWHPDRLTMASRRTPAQRADRWLSETLAGWPETYPDVRVHAEVTREHPTAGLVLAAHAQYLLVVGKRGPHPRALLGSVSQGVLHHATCPVAVVPTDRGRPAHPDGTGRNGTSGPTAASPDAV